MKMGCIVGLYFPPFSWEQVQKYKIKNSLSFEWMIGAAKYNNPLNSIKAIIETVIGKVAINEAKVEFVEGKNERGFSKGSVVLKDALSEYLVVFQNENLLLKRRKKNGGKWSESLQSS